MLYNSPKESKGTASSFNPNLRDWTQVVGRAVDKVNDWQVGLAGEKASAPRLGNEVAQGKPAARTDQTTKDGPRESPGSPWEHPTNSTSAPTPRGPSKGWERPADTSTYKKD
jgi:hypothetical protein